MYDQERVRCVIMRGGTSKAVFFHENDLPSDIKERDSVILKAFGSPDIRQIDGLGGANSSTSKVAVIGVSKRPDADIDYTFGQVSLDLPLVGKEMNCGNISSAVGPFAVDEGLVKAVEPVTVVRIFNTNTKKIIVAHVPVKDGKAVTKGDYEIHGVPGTGAKIDLEFEDPGGAATGKLLPTGVPQQVVEIEGAKYNISIVDAANPIVFIRAEELGLKGTELPWEVERKADAKRIMALAEKIRGTAAEMIGMVEDRSKAATLSPTLPKIGFYAAPAEYTDATGRVVGPEQIDIVGRLFSMGKIIHAYMGTGAVCTITAANIPGTVINEIVSPRLGNKVKRLRIGHPFGIMTVEARLEETDGVSRVKSATFSRTARRIMEGWVYIQK
ncbi:MAG: PrpF domain-containing protein [Peptococcaceae bacterium]|nr:3-methylitaconate isomerase [Peptococcaceae bacterium]MDH7523901.1 PrpF domain-containing protein [Peptococcaceae bacterium]